MHASTAVVIKERLINAFNPSLLEVQDDSEKHPGHLVGTDTPDAGHYTINIASAKFEGQSRVNCHRLVYDVLHDLMPVRIHALVINIKK